jgi:glycosyltransferase involved in cell wall biosynthesis
MSRSLLPGSGETDPRIVFVNRFYWPDESATGQLLTDLAEHMASQGATVTVVTSRLRYSSDDENFSGADEKNGVSIERIWTTSFGRSSIVGRLMDLMTFNVFAMIKLIRILRTDDLVVAKTDPPFLQLFAWFAVWLRRAKLINWCQDLFPEVAYALIKRSYLSRSQSFLSAFRNHALRQADCTVAVSKEMRHTLVQQGIDRNRLLVINNWCDDEIRPVPMEENLLRQKWQLQDDFVIGYSGNLGRAHVPESIYRLVTELAGISGLKMLFIGAGHGMDWLRQKCRDERFSHVVFKPYQPREDLSLSLSTPDVHLISLERGCQRYIAPSKFYGVLAAGRPIAFVGEANSDMAKDIRRSRFGITLALDRAGDWRRAVLDVMQDREELSTMARNARQAYEWRFRPSSSLEAWQNVLERTSSAASYHDGKALVAADP